MTCFRLKSGKTLSSFCKENKIYYSVLFSRIEKGETPDEAVENYLYRKKNNLKNARLTINGKKIRDVLTKRQFYRYQYYRNLEFSFEQSVKLATRER